VTKRKNDADTDRVKIRRIEAVSNVVSDIFKWGFIFGCMVMLSHCVSALAGKDTKADFLGELGLKIGISRWGAYLLAFVATSFGLGQRRLRLANVKRNDKRIKELERQLDAKRSSSKLDERGRTPRSS
jgi:hypothetical protein